MPSFEELCREVWEANRGIYRAGLVTMHSGNASGIDRKKGLVLIKPSGMDYDTLRPADLVVTDLEGRKVKGKWKASVQPPSSSLHLQPPARNWRHYPYALKLCHQLRFARPADSRLPHGHRR